MSSSSTTSALTYPSSPSTSSPPSSPLAALGLGNAIAIALGFLVLLSTLLLAFYVCRRRPHDHHHHHHHQTSPPPHLHHQHQHNVVLPRIIFVAEDGEDDGGGGTLVGGSHSPVPGLDPAAINSYPKFPFSRSKLGGGDEEGVCSICLCEYREGEMLRMMPDCRHYFHLMCVDAWLRLNASCPVCRTSPMPTPLSTPLSELVPLSQFSADRRRHR